MAFMRSYWLGDKEPENWPVLRQIVLVFYRRHRVQTKTAEEHTELCLFLSDALKAANLIWLNKDNTERLQRWKISKCTHIGKERIAKFWFTLRASSSFIYSFDPSV